LERERVGGDTFYFADLVAALISGAIWIFWPQAGGWPILIALLPWLARILTGQFTFPQSSSAALVGLFVLTAAVGYTISFDHAVAASKFWAIVASACLYLALIQQAPKSMGVLSLGLFLFGVMVALYFILSHDFLADPRRIGLINRLGVWLMGIRPSVDLPAIHPNYISGFSLMTSIFGIYWIERIRKSGKRLIGLALSGAGYAIVLAALVATTSRGVWMALVSAAGVYAVWKILGFIQATSPEKMPTLFPRAVLVYLALVIVLVYLGPAQSGSDLGTPLIYGLDSRAELFQRSLSLMVDFPLTGGGLGAFPALYAHYILAIPYFYLINSHNLFLDVALDQGVVGGMVFMVLYLGSVWKVASLLSKDEDSDRRIFNWLILFSLVVAIVHGLVDDYLYNDKGAIFSLLIVGVAHWSSESHKKIHQNHRHRRHKNSWGIFKGYGWATALLAAGFVLSVGIGILYSKEIRSMGYANLGALQMARYDLRGFPEKGWDNGDHVAELKSAKILFERALQLNPYNLTANHRLGLILMLEKDFTSAVQYLELANRINPNHRGVTKNLGYCYVWLDQMEKANLVLKNIPEAQEELDVYIWWWSVQGQPNLSEQAAKMMSIISPAK
jgi:tetratricopeptide (TPR) repeat protein